MSVPNVAHPSWRCMSVSLLAIVVSAGVRAADVAEMPVWKVGDNWTYQETSEPPRSERRWSRTITAVSPAGGYTAIRGDGVPLQFDAAGNELDQRGPEYCEEKRKFPMAVGSKWSRDRTLTMVPGKVGPQEVIERAVWEVTAFEKVSVSAGTFDCFRVSGVAQWLNMAFVGHVTATYWYCPSIRGVAKSEQVMQKYQGATVVTTIAELVSFKEGPEN